ncbi:hypothetical protein EX895_000149 [Sporisorium graminicola]|uniref:Uncharacterized protein n=1 Tax=Sporisorium graminicola TaxID=280036 RepID=A0A4U7KZ36_9BASI|nr:hypothetical protein EX895_000149 [Sporisorium graminicola]TKY90151.1 hypothetical protein EX895_000149 [Sporisorium graminicola]
MSTAVPAPARGYSSLPPSIRASQPMPAPLSRVALAAKQNQILALQALQAAAASASASSSSSSSSAAGSPPPSSSYAKSHSGTVYAVGNKRGRKFQAYRAPSVTHVSKDAALTAPSSSASDNKLVPLVTTSVPHWSAEGSHPLFDPNSGKRSEIYSLTNDRYPGAPGTALAKAREAQQKAIQAAKREAAKKLASKAELEHLGVKGLGKKRKSSSPYATVGGGLHASAVSPAVSPSSTKPDAVSTAMSRDSSRGRSSTKPQSETHLTVPSASRSRRPASRASSPAPITAQTSSSTRRAGTRSVSAAPAEEESSSSGSGIARNNRSSPSRGTSPPDNGKNHHGLASTAPFQSSPLAASAITMEPLLDTDEVDQNEAKPDASEATADLRSAAANKRKASALSQEVLADEGADAAVSDSLDEVSKRLRRDEAGGAAKEAGDEAAERTVKEGSPSSVSSSRRTSPRMTSRRIVAEAA